MKKPAKKAAARRQTIAEQLRLLIAARGLSGYALAEASGVDRANINRFLAGRSGLTLDSFDRIAEALGLRLVEVGRRVNRSSRRPDRKPVRPELLAAGVEPVEPEVE